MDKYIKAQDAISAFAEYLWAPLPRSASYAQTIVDAIPAEDVAPIKHGQWIKMTGMMPPEFHGHYECSLCEWHGKYNTKETHYLYCPNCGAKMDGEP